MPRKRRRYKFITLNEQQNHAAPKFPRFTVRAHYVLLEHNVKIEAHFVLNGKEIVNSCA